MSLTTIKSQRSVIIDNTSIKYVYVLSFTQIPTLMINVLILKKFKHAKTHFSGTPNNVIRNKHEHVHCCFKINAKKKKTLPDGESNPGAPRDRRGCCYYTIEEMINLELYLVLNSVQITHMYA